MPPPLTLLVITDGRPDYLERTLASFASHVDQSLITHRVVVDDSCRPETPQRLAPYEFDLTIRPPAGLKFGFSRAIAEGWQAVNEQFPHTSYLFHLEDDFTFNRYFDADLAMRVLDRHHHLAQMALRRQPWSEQEVLAGGFLRDHTAHHETISGDEAWWLTHREFYTTNPALVPRWVTRRPWPIAAESEGHFGLALFKDPATRCAYWGRPDDEPWVHHIGEHRAGEGY